MILVISSNRRQEIKDVVYKALVHGKQSELPVKIGAIIRSYKNIKLITFSSQLKKNDISYKEFIISSETKDSYVAVDGSTNKYCIYYNDIDENIVVSNRVRWNLAHELGHVLLRHHELCNRNKLLRGNSVFIKNIDDVNYSIAEEEADYFAKLILVPHAVVMAFKPKTKYHFSSLCKISNRASGFRKIEYDEWNKHIDKNDIYDNSIFKYYYNFIFKKYCTNCSTSVIQRYGNYCPICGNKTLKRGDGKMIYAEYEIDENGFLTTCMTCGNSKIIGDFCHICGSPVRNFCHVAYYPDNYEVICKNNTPLPGNARFCPQCGSYSLFSFRKMLSPWNVERDEFIQFEKEMQEFVDGFNEE